MNERYWKMRSTPRARVASKPMCVGFGSANAESAKRVVQIADGVIFGSAPVAQIGDEANAVDAAQNFVAELRVAMDR